MKTIVLILPLVAIVATGYSLESQVQVTYSSEVQADSPIYYQAGQISTPFNTLQDAAVNPGSGDFTLEAILTFSHTGIRVAAGKYGGIGDDYWLGSGLVGGGVISFSANGNGVSSPTPYNDNQPHHVVAVRESGQLSLYVDGVLVAGPVSKPDTINPSGNLWVGRFGSLTNYDWPGLVEDVAYYDHALSAARIAAHHAAIGTAPPPPSGYTTVDDTDAEGNAIQVLVPNAYDPSIGAKLVIYHHGVGENQTGWTQGDNLRKAGIRDALISQGYILAASNAGGNNWGNPASVQAYLALYAYCLRNYRITNQGEDVVFLSQSMGGMSGLNCLADQRFPCRGWYGIYPVCNLQSSYTLNFSGQINGAYGCDSSTYATKTAGYDPNLKPSSAYPIVPMRFVASYGDTVVPRVDHTDSLQGFLGPLMPEADIVDATGDHGDPSHFLPQDVVDFFGRCIP